MTPQLRIGSLFSGIEGLGLGLEAAGVGRIVWQVENDPHRRAVLAARYPDVPCFPDVRTATALPAVHVLCGGFPCQDISAANPRGAGLAGARSGLWFEFLRIIREVRPAAVVIENSPRLVRRGLDVVVSGLADEGFEVEATRIEAADVGAPHGRQRLFILAVAHAHLQRELRRGGADGEGWGWAGHGSAEVGHAHRPGLEELLDGHAPELPPALGAGGRPAEPRVGRAADGVPHRLDCHPWPDGQGEAQFPWEPPRIVAARSVPQRKQRIIGLGNAVVPRVAYVVGRRLVDRLGL